VPESWLHEALSRQKTELWLRVCCIKLCVATDLNCGLELITLSSVNTET